MTGHVSMRYQDDVPPLLRMVRGKRRKKDHSPSPPALRISDDELDICRPPKSSSDDEDEKDLAPKQYCGLKMLDDLSDDNSISQEPPSLPKITKTKFEKKAKAKNEPDPQRMSTRGSKVAASKKTAQEDDYLEKMAKYKARNKKSYGGKLKIPSGTSLSDSPPKKRAKLEVPERQPFEYSPETKKPSRVIVQDFGSSTHRPRDTRNVRTNATVEPSSSRDRMRGFSARDARLNRKAVSKVQAIDAARERKTLIVPETLDKVLSQPSISVGSVSNKPSLTGSFGSDSPLSTLPDPSDEDELALDSIRKTSRDANGGDGEESRCPMCETIVDAETLAEHASNPSFETDVWLQQKFCTAHRTATARQTWQNKGYPTIDWGETLDVRLRRHDGVVKSLFSNSGPAAQDSSFLRDFARKVRSGRERTLLQVSSSSKSMVAPGYYGPRGTRRISEFVARRFHDEIQRWAVENRLVSARGKMPFLESVVVPELATRLVMEDMTVGKEEAGKILQESGDVGELLNEDYGDEVVGDSDEDEDEDGGNLR